MYRNGVKIGTVKHITAFHHKTTHKGHRLVHIIYPVEEIGILVPNCLEEAMVMDILRNKVFALLFSC